MQGGAQDTILFCQGAERQVPKTVEESGWASANAVPPPAPRGGLGHCLPLGMFALSSLSGIKGQFTLPLRLFILFHT